MFNEDESARFQTSACKTLWLSCILAHVDQACGEFFKYPKDKLTFEAKLNTLIDMHNNYVRMYNKASKDVQNKTYCKYHIEREHNARLAEENLPTSKMVNKRCKQCVYCGLDRLYRYKHRPVNKATKESRQWLETDAFDQAVAKVDVGASFIEKTFRLVQYAISYEKRLHDQFSHQAEMHRKLSQAKYNELNHVLGSVKLTKNGQGVLF